MNCEKCTAWTSVYPLELEYTRSEMQPQFASIATPSEIVVSARFEIELAGVGGALYLCLPYATLEPIRETLYSSMQGDSSAPDHRWVDKLSQQIKSAEVDLVAELGHARATVADLVELKAGDFIELDLDQNLVAKVDGVLNTVFPILPAMQQRRAGQIGIMASLAAYRGFPGAPAYGASKAAVRRGA